MRQDAVQPLRIMNNFIYIKDDEGQLTKPFYSDYIKCPLYFMFFKKKPRFANIFQDEKINHHTIAVVCTFVSIFSFKFVDYAFKFVDYAFKFVDYAY